MKAIEDVAAAADRLAVRAQPQTMASRLSLRDFQDAVIFLSWAAHALGDGIEDRWAPLLEFRLQSVGRQAGARVNFAAGHLDAARAAMIRDLYMLRDRDPGNLDGQQTTGRRRWLVRAADQFAARCQDLREETFSRPLTKAEQEATLALLRAIFGNFGSAVNHVALLTDNACERALGRTSGTLTPLIQARQEIEKARQRVDVLKAVVQG